MQYNLFDEPVKLRGGFIFDAATKKPVDLRKPEEKVRQGYERILKDDYGYSYEQMDIEVHIQRGSKTKPKTEADRADIVIYKSEDRNKRDQNRDILGIVETKRPNREDGVRQLMSYMSASSALWGVWTNEKEIEYLYKNPETGAIKRNYVFQIPKRGETFEDIGKISKKNLKPAKNLTMIFRRILNTLYANTNISRREKLGNEMIRLLFCKIWDEMYQQHLPPKFKIGFKDDTEDVKTNIDELFNEVKNELVEDGVFDENEKILLDSKSVAYVVGELQRYSLMKTDKDVVGDAFEIFAESRFAGEKGEFFTPRPIVKTCVEIADPQPQQKIFDPACGSGGFLIYALEHVWNIMDKNPKYRGSPNLKSLKSQMAQKYFFGIDKEIDLVKIAKAYMAIVGDGKGGIVQQNSLHRPEEFEGRAKDLFVYSRQFKKFDIILTNPPFGSKIKVLKEEAGNFKLGHIWKRHEREWIQTKERRDTEPQLLFIERCLEMLKNGGTLGIVLPETIFHAPSDKYILDFIRSGNNIRCIVDLAHNTFRPFNNAKTVLLILNKGEKQQNKIMMAVAEEVGHDHTGRLIYRFDYEKQQFTDEIWDDTEIIRKELKTPFNPDNQNLFVVDVKDLKNHIFVPRYYWKKRIEKIEKAGEKLDLEFVPVKELIDKEIVAHFSGHGSPPAKFKGRGEIPYVRVADIVNWDVYKNPTALIPEKVYFSTKGNGVDLQERDILFVRRGSYRIGSVAMVSPFDKKVLLTREISVFRVVKEKNEWDINPYYLIYLFSHKLTQQQLYNKIFIDTTLPNIGDRWQDLLLPISKDRKERDKITSRVKEVFDQKWNAQTMINNLSGEFGKLTT